MTTAKTKVVSVLASGVLVASAAPAAAVAVDTAGQETQGAYEATSAKQDAGQAQKQLDRVKGSFAWNQGVTASNEELAKRVYGAADYLCSSESIGLAAESGKASDAIRVGGDVAHAFTASVAEYEKAAPVKKIMGCTCYGNPADGLASANAEVGGFQLKALIADAQPASGANTITFTCADGYQVALPLSYVKQRYSIIVTGVNGESASDAVGCTNQLWLGSTSARSFARDIVAIDITKEANPPAAPGAGGAVPNVSVISAQAAVAEGKDTRVS